LLHQDFKGQIKDLGGKKETTLEGAVDQFLKEAGKARNPHLQGLQKSDSAGVVKQTLINKTRDDLVNAQPSRRLKGEPDFYSQRLDFGKVSLSDARVGYAGFERYCFFWFRSGP
jgi:hypothetical protein